MKLIKLKVNLTTGIAFENNRKVSTLACVRGDVVVLAFEIVKTLDTGVDVPVDMSQVSVIRHSIAKDRMAGTLALVAGNAFNQLNDVAVENLSGGKFTMKLDLKSDKLAKALVDAGTEAIEAVLEVSTIFPVDYPTTLLQLRTRIFGDIDHYQVTDPVKDFLLLSQNDFTDAYKSKLDGLGPTQKTNNNLWGGAPYDSGESEECELSLTNFPIEEVDVATDGGLLDELEIGEVLLHVVMRGHSLHSWDNKMVAVVFSSLVVLDSPNGTKHPTDTESTLVYDMIGGVSGGMNGLTPAAIVTINEVDGVKFLDFAKLFLYGSDGVARVDIDHVSAKIITGVPR